MINDWPFEGHRAAGLNLVENCLDSLCSASEYLLEEQDIKTAVLWTAASIEQLVKSLLASEHWTLVIEDLNRLEKKKDPRASYLAGTLKTVSFGAGLDRLAKCTSTRLSRNQRNRFDQVYTLRNRITHFDQPANLEEHGELLKEALLQATELYVRYLHVRVAALIEPIGQEAHQIGIHIGQREQWWLQEDWSRRSLLAVSPEKEHDQLRRLYDLLVALYPLTSSDAQIKRKIATDARLYPCFLCTQRQMRVLDGHARCDACKAFMTRELFMVRGYRPTGAESKNPPGEPFRAEESYPCKKCGDAVLYTYVGCSVCYYECIRCSWRSTGCLYCGLREDKCECCAECGNRRYSDRCQGDASECPRNDPTGGDLEEA